MEWKHTLVLFIYSYNSLFMYEFLARFLVAQKGRIRLLKVRSDWRWLALDYMALLDWIAQFYWLFNWVTFVLIVTIIVIMGLFLASKICLLKEDSHRLLSNMSHFTIVDKWDFDHWARSFPSGQLCASPDKPFISFIASSNSSKLAFLSLHLQTPLSWQL